MDRITYIYLYSNEEVRYIMNRSIAFENVIGKKMMDALIYLGYNTYAKLLYDLESELQQFKYDVEHSVGNISIIETHVEWPNEKHINQKEINQRKRELAERLDAVVCKTDIEVEDADIQAKIVVMSVVKRQMQNMFNVLAPFVKSDLIDEINQLNEQKRQLNSEIHQINFDIDRRRNTIIDLDIEDRGIKNHIKNCNYVLENKLEPKVYEFYSEKLRKAMRNREEETLKYLQEKLNK